MALKISDVDWLRQAFVLPENGISELDQERRVFSHSYRKFTDTTLGGNWTINSPPQFTRHADVKERRRYKQVSRGMGRYYSEAIDDNAVSVTMRFGVPEFNGLSTFFQGFYDPEASILARTGRAPGFLFKVAELAGTVLTIVPQVLIILATTVKYLSGRPRTQYYYMKPTMPLYWSSVNTILNQLATNMGLVPGVPATGYEKNMGDTYDGTQISKTQTQQFNKLLPDIFRADGGIDIYAVANRAQRLSHQWHKTLEQELENVRNRSDAIAKMRNMYDNWQPTDAGKPRLGDALNLYTSLNAAQPPTADNADAEMVGSLYPEDQGLLAKTAEALNAELHDGSQFVSFRVNNPGSIGESFSNSARDSSLASTLNGTASASSEARFTFSNGVTGIPGLDTIIGAASDVIQGAISGAQIGGIANLLIGSAYVDIPKHWDSSTCSLPRADYTIELRSPYGNKMSRFQNLMVPLAMLLAGALPLSAGPASFTAPFLCELYSPGRNQIRLGMIDSLSITRGVGNLGWTKDHEPLGIDISFSVLDMSSVMHMPIKPNVGPLDITNPAKMVAKFLADDTTYSDYMAVLGSLGLTEQVYRIPSLARNFNKTVQEFDTWLTPTHFASWVGGTLPARVVTAFVRGTDRP